MTARVCFAVLLIATALAAAPPVFAHSASDAYLTLDMGSAGADTVIEGQWDIALRDLHFVRKLDDDGDGRITWGEMRRHRADIEDLAFGRIKFEGDGAPCALTPSRQLVSNHADGAYAALFFRIVCKGGPRKVTLDYRLFFDVDPTHRGIVVVRSGKATATSLMSPSSARMDLTKP